MVKLTVIGGIARAAFGWLGSKDARKRAERLEQLKLILAAERARTRKRDFMAYLLIILALGVLAGDLYYTGGGNLEWLLQVLAMVLAQ